MKIRTTAATVLLLAALSGCSTGATDADEVAEAGSEAQAGAFPVTIEHAFGETTIEEEPQRVATLGWTDQDHVLALGVVPVGATKLTWGGNEQGSSDWFDEELAEEFPDAEPPARYDDSDGAPVDEVAQLAPDLVLATNSGLTEAEYKKLSKFTKVVVYPEAPWVTPWETSLETVGKALGRSDLAAEIAADVHEDIQETTAENPSLDGASMIFASIDVKDLSQLGVYGRQDPRVSILEDFGLVSPSVVEDVVDQGMFYGTVSAERADSLDSDVLITYAESPSDVETFAADPLIGRIPALRGGHVYAEADKHVGLAITNPTPLSIPFIEDHVIPQVVQAVQGS